MIVLERHRLVNLHSGRHCISEICHKRPSQDFLGLSKILTKYTNTFDSTHWPSYYNFSRVFSLGTGLKFINQNPLNPSPIFHLNKYPYRCLHHSFYSSHSGKRMSSSFRKLRKTRANAKPTLNEEQFHRALSHLLPRFGPEELCSVLNLQDDPVVCLELFNWASQQPRFRHDVSTYHVTIKRLGAAKMYQEMDDVINQVLGLCHFGSEALYNTMIYYFTEARKLTRAVNIYKHMRNCKNLASRPSIRTYNLLFTAFLSKGKNTYVNYMYVETMSTLFKQMVSDGIEPDIYSLNAMIKGYTLSLHVNDALRIFHQMGVVYTTMPNSHSYDYLIHGLCAQGRTDNATELCDQMKEKGFIPSSKAYNSFVNALALGGEIDKAVEVLWEMIANRRYADLITFRTILDEICQRGRVKEAMKLLNELQQKDLVDENMYKKLLCILEDDYGNFSAKF